jgi:hypothetical protein
MVPFLLRLNALRLPWLVAGILAGAVLVAAPAATGSQLIDRNATGVKLETDSEGEAMITYTAGGKLKHVLAWGAIDANPPTPGGKQVAFSLDYSGGYGKYHKANYWVTGPAGGWSCLPYDGPKLAFEVAACKAPDGSYWALQAWQRALPDYAVTPSATQSVYELHLSHWKGELPVLQIGLDWSYHKYVHLYGTYTYGGVAVYGFHSTPAGQPLDSFGRNIYIDTFDSAYGTGWKRENSFLTHGPKGSFCYGFYPHGSHPSGGTGTQFRAITMGPGVAPDVMWQGNNPGPYNAAADATANAAQKALGDKSCKVN